MMRRGQAGRTHCGSWTPVDYCEKYGWTSRLVCVRTADHKGKHKSRTGWEW